MIYYFFIENKKKVTWFLDFSLYKKNSYMKSKKRSKQIQKFHYRKKKLLYYINTWKTQIFRLVFWRSKDFYIRKKESLNKDAMFFIIYQILILFRDLWKTSIVSNNLQFIQRTTICNFEVSNINQAMPTII